jgi:N-acyl amino acid synthase of PEP-CTERM/exosortase system
MADFAGSYNQYFDVVRADNPQLLELAYRLRYQVYCVENPFEDPTRCRDRREVDEDDDRSVHTLLIHRPSRLAAGTARVIMPRLGANRPLPIEGLIGRREWETIRHLPRLRTAEISRFAVSKEFRRRSGEQRYADARFPYPAADGGHKRLVPYITFGLLRGILEICLEHEITMLTAVMDPALLRLLTRLGLHFEPLGPLVEHHGLRQPCIAEIAALIENSRDQASLLWGYLEASGATRPMLALPQPGGDRAAAC